MLEKIVVSCNEYVVVQSFKDLKKGGIKNYEPHLTSFVKFLLGHDTVHWIFLTKNEQGNFLYLERQ